MFFCLFIVSITQKPFVLRSYDTRVRSTYRSPELYKDQHLCNDTKIIIRLKDCGSLKVQEFGDGGFADGKVFSTLFSSSRRGMVEIIQIAFHNGSHACTHIEQAIAVAKSLQDLHQKQFVHGDIRALNMVFTTQKGPKTGDTSYGGYLIDFDFGGRLGAKTGSGPLYPCGYKQLLTDGKRRGRGGQSITKSDDVSALFDVFLKKHIFPYPISKKLTEELHGKLNDPDKIPETIEDLLEILEDLKNIGAGEMFIADKDFKTLIEDMEKRNNEATKTDKMDATANNNNKRKPKPTPYGAQFSPWKPKGKMGTKTM